jgi:hypothetical protein
MLFFVQTPASGLAGLRAHRATAIPEEGRP